MVRLQILTKGGEMEIGMYTAIGKGQFFILLVIIINLATTGIRSRPV